MQKLIGIIFFSCFLGISSPALSEHGEGTTKSRTVSQRPIAEARTNLHSRQALTAEEARCFIDLSGKVIYLDKERFWRTATKSKLKEAFGEFTNIDGDKISYAPGDLLVKTGVNGWFNGGHCKDLRISGNKETDPRCRYAANLDLNNPKEVAVSNKACAIEWEALRYTVAKRLGIPPNALWQEDNHERLETEMNKKWDPDFSYFVRQRAKVMINTGQAGAHGGDYHGPVNSYNSTISPKKTFTVSVARENAWPTASQGTTVDEIAFNLTETRATASDGYPAGLNYHPGHAQNVVGAADIIGVGVDILPNGAITSYFQFTSKIKK